MTVRDGAEATDKPALCSESCAPPLSAEEGRAKGEWLDTLNLVLSKRSQAELALVAICFAWGAGFLLTKDVLGDASPQVFVFLRFLFASTLLLGLYARQLDRNHARGAVVAGALLAGGFILQTAGIEWTTPSRSAFLTALCIPLTPLLQSLLLWRRLLVREVLGAGVAALGTFLLTKGGDGGSTAGSNVLRGDLLSLGCAVVFALHMLALAHFGQGPAFRTVSVGQLGVAAVVTLPFIGAWEQPRLRVTGLLLGSLAFTAVLCTALAFTILTWAQSHTSATRAAVVCSTESLFAAVLSFLFRGEHLGAVAILGACLILASVLLGELRPPPLPPPPAWLPAALRSRWARVRAEQEAAAAPGPATELTERVALLEEGV